jgi:hypothetical protein
MKTMFAPKTKRAQGGIVMLIRNLVLALALLSLTACGEKEGKDGDSETNMSVKEICQKVLDKKFSQSKYDEKREKEPEVFEKKKEYKVAKCVSKLTEKKEKHPEFVAKLATCAAKHDEYKAMDKCMDKANEFQRELSYAELLKKDKKSYESAKYGVELRAPTGGQIGDYTFLEYKEPYFTVELEQFKCGWSLQNDRERGGGPKATFDDEKWCARGESHIRQIAKGKAFLGNKVTSVTSLPNGNGTYLVQAERKEPSVREGEEPSIVREIAVYLPRANDLVICKALRVDGAKELALAKEICSSLKPL